MRIAVQEVRGVDSSLTPLDEMMMNMLSISELPGRGCGMISSNGRESRTMELHELGRFRTQICPRKRSNDACEWEERCPFSHCLSWHRRNPFLSGYRPGLCPNVLFTVGSDRRMRVRNFCRRGRACLYSHTKEEQMYHPLVYKTQLCRDFPDCFKLFCPFAHGAQDLRSKADINMALLDESLSQTKGSEVRLPPTSNTMSFYRRQTAPGYNNSFPDMQMHCANPHAPCQSEFCVHCSSALANENRLLLRGFSAGAAGDQDLSYAPGYAPDQFFAATAVNGDAAEVCQKLDSRACDASPSTTDVYNNDVQFPWAPSSEVSSSCVSNSGVISESMECDNTTGFEPDSVNYREGRRRSVTVATLGGRQPPPDSRFVDNVLRRALADMPVPSSLAPVPEERNFERLSSNSISNGMLAWASQQHDYPRFMPSIFQPDNIFPEFEAPQSLAAATGMRVPAAQVNGSNYLVNGAAPSFSLTSALFNGASCSKDPAGLTAHFGALQLDHNYDGTPISATTTAEAGSVYGALSAPKATPGDRRRPATAIEEKLGRLLGLFPSWDGDDRLADAFPCSDVRPQTTFPGRVRADPLTTQPPYIDTTDAARSLLLEIAGPYQTLSVNDTAAGNQHSQTTKFL